ncbi:hypothetical protein HDU76_010329, partial [Blyttiomyces sp. JEL0837]
MAPSNTANNTKLTTTTTTICTSPYAPNMDQSRSDTTAQQEKATERTPLVPPSSLGSKSVQPHQHSINNSSNCNCNNDRSTPSNNPVSLKLGHETTSPENRRSRRSLVIILSLTLGILLLHVFFAPQIVLPWHHTHDHPPPLQVGDDIVKQQQQNDVKSVVVPDPGVPVPVQA